MKQNKSIVEVENIELMKRCHDCEIELYETRIAMYRLIKAFRKTEMSPQQAKLHTQAESILIKYTKATDALRNEALSAGEGEKKTPENPGTIDGLFIEYKETGECRIDIAKTINLWDENWFISQWHDQYTIVKGDKEVKARISKRQAKELIVELDLMPEQSQFFRNGKTWKNQKEEE